jgi:hypothetical protein
MFFYVYYLIFVYGYEYGDYHISRNNIGELTVDYAVRVNDPICMRIVFIDKTSSEPFVSKISTRLTNYASISNIFGYYNDRYYYANGVDDTFTLVHNKKLKETIFTYGDYEFKILKGNQIVECHNVRLLLQQDRVTKIIVEKDKPLTIIAHDGWLFEPPVVRKIATGL